MLVWLASLNPPAPTLDFRGILAAMTGKPPLTVDGLRAALTEIKAQSGQPIRLQDPLRLIVGPAAYDIARLAKSPPKTGNAITDAEWEYLWYAIHGKAAK